MVARPKARGKYGPTGTERGTMHGKVREGRHEAPGGNVIWEIGELTPIRLPMDHGLSLREVQEALRALNDEPELVVPPSNQPILLGAPPQRQPQQGACSASGGPRQTQAANPPTVPPPATQATSAPGGSPHGGIKATGLCGGSYGGALVFNVDPTRPLKVLGQWDVPQAPFWKDEWFHSKNWLNGEQKRHDYAIMRLRVKRAWW